MSTEFVIGRPTLYVNATKKSKAVVLLLEENKIDYNRVDHGKKYNGPKKMPALLTRHGLHTGTEQIMGYLEAKRAFKKHYNIDW